MAKKLLISLLLLSELFFGGRTKSLAQDDAAHIQVNVVLVQLNVAVTDRKGNYVSGLRPEDFMITDDSIPEKIATFEEGNEPTRILTGATLSKTTPESAPTLDGKAMTNGDPTAALASPFEASNVFILFDTSNYMYRGFTFAQDSIADFVRSLEGANNVALYAYSRNLSRVATLTSDKSRVLHAVRSTVAGDEAALYNSLLLTVKDAAPLKGKKAIVVFSNGPDDISLVPPEDVAELAQSTGTIIYMISTHQAQSEPVSAAVFERMSKATGGRSYFAKDWRDEAQAFASIRDDMAHLYTLSYYPLPNMSRAWRPITVKLVGKDLQQYHIRTRDGYRLLKPGQLSLGGPSATQ